MSAYMTFCWLKQFLIPLNVDQNLRNLFLQNLLLTQYCVLLETLSDWKGF